MAYNRSIIFFFAQLFVLCLLVLLPFNLFPESIKGLRSVDMSEEWDLWFQDRYAGITLLSETQAYHTYCNVMHNIINDHTVFTHTHTRNTTYTHTLPHA